MEDVLSETLKGTRGKSVERRVRFDYAIIASAIPADIAAIEDSRFYRSLVAGSAAVSILEHENCEDRTKGPCVCTVVEEYIAVYTSVVVSIVDGHPGCADSEAYTGQSRMVAWQRIRSSLPRCTRRR